MKHTAHRESEAGNSGKLRGICSTTLLYIFVAVASLSFMTGCGQKEFSIRGQISDSSGRTLLLEKADFTGRWILLDSVQIGTGGNFNISYPASATPEIYRLDLDGKYLYIPIDSTESITVKSSAKDFGNIFTLSGSEQAEKMTRFTTELYKTRPEDYPTFKKTVMRDIILPGQGDLMSYYVLTHVVGDKPLFDVRCGADAQYFAAVATAYQQYRPEDPRTKLLEQMAISAMKARNADSGKKTVIKAPETSLIDMEFRDKSGTARKLSEVSGNGHPTLLIFSFLNEKESPAITRRISELYQRYGKRINFYQVCLDRDITSWRQAAEPLGWTVVIDPSGVNSRVAASYAVRQMPAFFLINAKGELTARADDFDTLNALLKNL